MQVVARIESSHQSGAGEVQIVADGDDVARCVGGGDYGYQYHFVPVLVHFCTILLLLDAIGDELGHVVECVGVVTGVEGGQV